MTFRIEDIELAKQRKKFTVLVIPHHGSKILEFKLSYPVLWGIGSALAFLLCMVFAGVWFFFQARDWEHVARIRDQDNARLRAEVARVDELAHLVTRMKAGEQQLRSVLASHTDLPPAPDEAIEVATRVVQSVSGQRVDLDMRWVPSIWPIAPSMGWVTREFEPAKGVFKNRHSGIDIAAVEGTPVQASADGQVVFADVDPMWEYMVVIDHGGIYTTRYGHNRALLVEKGARVRQGQYIALVGNSGQRPYLHYEVIKGERACNPRDFLPGE